MSLLSDESCIWWNVVGWAGQGGYLGPGQYPSRGLGNHQIHIIEKIFNAVIFIPESLQGPKILNWSISASPSILNKQSVSNLIFFNISRTFTLQMSKQQRRRRRSVHSIELAKAFTKLTLIITPACAIGIVHFHGNWLWRNRSSQSFWPPISAIFV